MRVATTTGTPGSFFCTAERVSKKPGRIAAHENHTGSRPAQFPNMVLAVDDVRFRRQRLS